jgi:hypothetical protein
VVKKGRGIILPKYVNLGKIKCMATQVIDQQMVEYFMQLNNAEKKSVVQLIKTFLKARNDSPGRISIEQYNKELDEAEAEIERGEFYTQEQVEEMSKSWVNGK